MIIMSCRGWERYSKSGLSKLLENEAEFIDKAPAISEKCQIFHTKQPIAVQNLAKIIVGNDF
jgi:hypothetical protein